MSALPRCDQVHRISIISRGSALGWTLSLPGDDQHLVDEEALRDQLAGIMGGAGRVLADRRDALRLLAERLIAEETIDGEELERLLASGHTRAHAVTVVG
jgi:ATP-dependent Zn protease